MESHFKTPTNGTRGSREQQRQKLTPFKTPAHILDRDLVKNRSRQTSFKTMDKSGRKNIASQDTVRKVSENLIPFKTPDIKYRTSRVHFKTFDDWIKARKMNCDMVLKDVSKVSFQKRRRRTSRDPTPAADSPTANGQRGMVTPRCPDHPP